MNILFGVAAGSVLTSSLMFCLFVVAGRWLDFTIEFSDEWWAAPAWVASFFIFLPLFGGALIAGVAAFLFVSGIKP